MSGMASSSSLTSLPLLITSPVGHVQPSLSSPGSLVWFLIKFHHSSLGLFLHSGHTNVSSVRGLFAAVDCSWVSSARRFDDLCVITSAVCKSIFVFAFNTLNDLLVTSLLDFKITLIGGFSTGACAILKRCRKPKKKKERAIAHAYS